MCNYKRNHLNIDYEYAFSFDDCIYDVEHKILAARCKACHYNLVDFARKYFAFIICYCYQTDKNLVCRHCKQLLHDLNWNTIKDLYKGKGFTKGNWAYGNRQISWNVSQGRFYFFTLRKNIVSIFPLTLLIVVIFSTIKRRSENFFFILSLNIKIGDGDIWSWFYLLLPLFCFWYLWMEVFYLKIWIYLFCSQKETQKRHLMLTILGGMDQYSFPFLIICWLFVLLQGNFVSSCCWQ